jgi:hypothetical protein
MSDTFWVIGDISRLTPEPGASARDILDRRYARAAAPRAFQSNGHDLGAPTGGRNLATT